MRKLKVLGLTLLLLLTSCGVGDVTEPIYVPSLYIDNNQTVGPAYGQLWTENVSTSLTITVANHFYRYTFNNTGLSHLANLTTSNITVGANGTYLVSMSASSYSSSATPRETHWHVFKNNIELDEVTAAATRNLGLQGTTSSSGIVALIVGDVIDLRVTSMDAGNIITTDHASLVITRIGP